MQTAKKDFLVFFYISMLKAEKLNKLKKKAKKVEEVEVVRKEEEILFYGRWRVLKLKEEEEEKVKVKSVKNFLCTCNIIKVSRTSVGK